MVLLRPKLNPVEAFAVAGFDSVKEGAAGFVPKEKGFAVVVVVLLPNPNDMTDLCLKMRKKKHDFQSIRSIKCDIKSFKLIKNLMKISAANNHSYLFNYAI